MPTVVVRDVQMSRARATLYFDSAPKWLIMEHPPPRLDAVIGVEMRVTDDAIYVAGALWARRFGRYIALVPRKGNL